MNSFKRFALRSASLLMLCCAAAAQAQGPTGPAANPVLKGSQVTESALVDALAIEPPEAASGATRGFRPAGKPGAPPVKAGPGKASLLITFATNAADLSTDAQRQLDVMARALQTDTLAGFSFRVEGHADARGEAEINQRLSQQRAQAVVDYLVTKHGILADRLNAVGRGSAEPLNKAQANAPENRRVTFVTTRG